MEYVHDGILHAHIMTYHTELCTFIYDSIHIHVPFLFLRFTEWSIAYSSSKIAKRSVCSFMTIKTIINAIVSFLMENFLFVGIVLYHLLSPTCSLCNLILIEWKKYIIIVRDMPLNYHFKKHCPAEYYFIFIEWHLILKSGLSSVYISKLMLTDRHMTITPPTNQLATSKRCIWRLFNSRLAKFSGNIHSNAHEYN